MRHVYCVRVDKGGHRRSHENPRRFVERLAALLRGEQQRGEDYSFDELSECVVGHPHWRQTMTNAPDLCLFAAPLTIR
jgi:hypothetical protein